MSLHLRGDDTRFLEQYVLSYAQQKFTTASIAVDRISIKELKFVSLAF